MREEIIEKILKEKLIAIVRGVPDDKILQTAEALCRGGVRLMEITYNAGGNPPDEVTAEQIRKVKERFGSDLSVGAGTVLSPAQVTLTAAVGGEFIISPDANETVIRRTRECGLVSIPGALTPTEVQAAHRAGADFVKLFPTDTLGVAYIKAIRAPLSHIRMLAVGGVNENNMSDFFAAGVCGFGIGSGIVNAKLIEAGDFDALAEHAKRYVAALRKCEK